MIGLNPVEFNGMIGRTQDFTIMKHNDDMKPVIDQGNSQLQVQQNVENKASTVSQGQKTDTDSEGSGNHGGYYGGDGGQNRKKKADVPAEGKVLIKGKGSFDISI